jgi:cytochrome c
MRTLGIWSGALLLAGAAGAQQTPPGDPEAGSTLARQWCASCHLVSADQASAGEAPPFATIARRSPDAVGALTAFLMNPHPPMPDMSLTRAEIRDLLAYIATLR